MRSIPVPFAVVVAVLVGACTATVPVVTPSPPPAPLSPLTPSPDATVRPSPSPSATAAATSSPRATGSPSAEGGGPRVVTGSLSYTNPFFTEGVAQPVIILEDQGGFVARDRDFVIPVESQVMGQITSDFETSPFTYSLTLPAEPSGTEHDVDNDTETDAGVQIFAVAYWTNTWGDPFLEVRDQGGGGWSSAYASTRVSDDRDAYLEVYGGKLLVFAPDAEQAFPSGFGADERLFTADDPVMPIPQGWSVVDLDESPFAIDRSEEAQVDLLEPEQLALDDFSSMGYVEAFDALVEKFRNEYAFTEFKRIDWDALAASLRPRFEEAERTDDAHAYALALRDFTWSIPDSHVSMSQDLVEEDFFFDTAGGLGMAMTETDDGQFIVTFVLEQGPAEAAGIEFGAELLEIDGQPVATRVESIVPWTSPFSNPVLERLHQVAWALRFPADVSEVEVRFRNPGGGAQTATLATENEFDSLQFGLLFGEAEPTALPVEYSELPSGLGYLRITSFLDNDVLSVQVWERAMRYFNASSVPGVIVDMRSNGGGSGWLADQLAAYFFTEETVVGNTAFYDESTGEFVTDPGDEESMIPPEPELQYRGPVAVIVGPGCASACEFFSYDMTIDDRATIVGHYPTSGAGGSVEDVLMPENISVRLTIGRALDANGQIHIEGGGVAPDVDVPVTVDTLQAEASGEDVLLQAAEQALLQPER